MSRGREHPPIAGTAVVQTRYYATIQTKTRNKECLPAPEEHVPGHYGIRYGRPVDPSIKPTRMHLLHEGEKESPACRGRTRDVYREVRVPEPGGETDRSRAGD